MLLHPAAPARLGLSLVILVAGCTRERATPPCATCATVQVAAVREPPFILPPLVQETVGRDIGDRVFDRLATLAPGAATIDLTGYRPALAERWERVDSLTWRFMLRKGARWHDGRPVTADDVVFSFEAYVDTALAAMAGPALDGVRATARDSTTVEVRFPRPGTEQLYDATAHVRVLPRHVWSEVPRGEWAADTNLARLVGSGPYRVQSWQRGQSLTLDADTARSPVPDVRRLVWRFTADPEAALNLVLAHEADLLETVMGDEAAARVAADTSFRLVRYPAAVFGFLGFRVAGPGGAHPVLGDREVRRALTLATDRASLARALVGEGATVPPGPMSRLLWIAGEGATPPAYDTAAAASQLERAGWRREGERRVKAGRPLVLDILVPSTSTVRRRYAEALQAAWRPLGVEATVTAVDFPVFQQRLAEGQFDSYIGAYLDEPSPRGIVEQWTTRGIGALNHGRWSSPSFDADVELALAAPDLATARRRWRAALDTLAAEAPAIFLYTPEQRAAVQRRIGGVEINPYSWLEGVEKWTVDVSRAR
ncbi:MAG TPA: peptide ABC transporter substrate-binding protein [Gemmatimonadales bacterium]|nr:peptide ABC transporter substrate-binding protein [Gemmatimonadales bacterium]